MGDTKNTVKEQDFQVIDGGKGADNKDTIKINKLKVFKSELVNVEYLNADDKFPYGKPQTDEVARGSGTESMAVRD